MNHTPNTGDVLLGIATADRQELRLIQDALKARWATLTKEEASAFTVGQRVFFVSKRGERVEGTIEKINRKTIGVKVNDWTSYRVSPSFLEVC
tara:strand:+ start:666 stop:944 length:279 start_codon:yes stop_codon:yes gene_type:complete